MLLLLFVIFFYFAHQWC